MYNETGSRIETELEVAFEPEMFPFLNRQEVKNNEEK